MDRMILHCDLNNFYASVECLARPELKDVPMAVCGDAQNRRGIILAKNQRAKEYGIVTAETVWQATKKCPDLVMVAPHHGQYSKYSRIVFAIYARYTDRVEPFGIDEAWLDVTGSVNLMGSGRHIADEIRETVKREVGLTVSVGVSFNKIFAKLGSDYKKPNATTVISRDNYQKFVHPLPVSVLLYVGKAAAATLGRLGITTIGQLAGADKTLIVNALGKFGATCRDNANGLDKSAVRHVDDKREVKSVGKGTTFGHNLVGIDEIKAGLLPLAESVASRLRKNGHKCSTVQLTIRDPAFKTITRQKKLHSATYLTTDILCTAVEILKESWNMNAPIRMLTITGANLVSETRSEQMSFLDSEVDERRKKLERIAHSG